MYWYRIALNLLQASIMRGLGATNRIFGLLDRDPAIPATTSQAIPVPKPVPTAASPGGILRFEGVGFAYPSRPSARILDKFTLEVNAGESVALVGMSGSGKSSVNALLLRYYDPDAGKVTFDGIGEPHSDKLPV
jgi:ABC-type multidrug transport system fused ATPase/permease subunit